MGQHEEGRLTATTRAEKVAELVGKEPRPWVIWAPTDYEADAAIDALGMGDGALHVHGRMTPERKADALVDFIKGGYPVLVTKPRIGAMGLNLQHCQRSATMSTSYSWDYGMYQAEGRFHRSGQTEPVHCHYVYAKTEAAQMRTVMRKNREHDTLIRDLIEAQKESA